MENCKVQLLSLAVGITLLGTVLCGSYSEETTPEGQTKLKIKPPVLSEEETDSSFIPDHMRCDGCRAVAFQIFQSLIKAELKFKSTKKPLPESELLDALENTCSGKTFEAYALKDIDGKNMLSGPGIEKEAKGPAMMQGGGHWPGRLSNICGDFLDKYGEDDIYAKFRKNEKLEDFETALCRGSGGSFCGEKKDEL